MAVNPYEPPDPRYWDFQQRMDSMKRQERLLERQNAILSGRRDGAPVDAGKMLVVVIASMLLVWGGSAWFFHSATPWNVESWGFTEMDAKQVAQDFVKTRDFYYDFGKPVATHVRGRTWRVVGQDDEGRRDYDVILTFTHRSSSGSAFYHVESSHLEFTTKNPPDHDPFEE